MGKINTINKFRQFKNKSDGISKNFNSIRQGINMKNSMVSSKNSRKTSKKPNKKKPKKKIAKKKKPIEKKKEKKETKLELKEKVDLDISECFGQKEALRKPLDRFGEGKKVIQYLFEDSKGVSDQEMFHFLILTNQFYSENLIR